MQAHRGKAAAGASIALFCAAILGCGEGAEDPQWTVIAEELPGALLSVAGASPGDVWAVGGDARDGTGPVVLHLKNDSWERMETGLGEGDLWWVHTFAGGPTFMGGSGGIILRYDEGVFEVLETPGSGTVFGLWGTSPTDMWAVGGDSDAGGGFAWRLEGDAWIPEPSLPASVAETGALWKVHGTSSDDAWLVGSSGLAFHWDGQSLEAADTGVGSSLFTVFGDGSRFVAVGGLATGIIVENEGSGWVDVTPDPLPLSLTGVCLDGAGSGYAVGAYGNVYRREGSAWQVQNLGLGIDENLHAVWLDSQGGVWAAGGNTAASPVTQGVLIHRGPEIPAFSWTN